MSVHSASNGGMGLAASNPFATTPVSAVESPGHGGISPVAEASDALIGIDDVQRALNRSRASVYRYTNTDPRNLNPPFNPRKLNPEYRSDQKEPLLFHPNEVARFARDVLRIKEVTVEVLEVDMDRERATFAENSVKYEATLRFINGYSKTILSAIQGQ